MRQKQATRYQLRQLITTALLLTSIILARMKYPRVTLLSWIVMLVAITSVSQSRAELRHQELVTEDIQANDIHSTEIDSKASEETSGPEQQKSESDDVTVMSSMPTQEPSLETTADTPLTTSNVVGETPEDDSSAAATESVSEGNGLAENQDTLNETLQIQNVSSMLNETKTLRTVALCALLQDIQLPVLDVSGEGASDDNDTGTSESNIEGISAEMKLNAEGAGNETHTPETSDDQSPSSGKASLRLVNMTELVQDVLWSNSSIKSRIIPANCSIVLFYASWCPFSAKAAPHFNALPRAFPSLRVAAIDVSQHSSVNSYFGILSVPTVVLYHNGKSIAKFNESLFSLHKFAEFIQTHTDLRSDDNINVTSQDFAGPIPSVTTKGVDLYLILAWVFIVACFFYYVTKSALWRRAIDLVRTTWREAEDHVHQD